MQLMTKDTDKLVLQLIQKCKRLRWAVAWASSSFPLYQTLKLNEHKIDQLIVGVHFYQTHPEFIKAFLNHSKVRFKLDTQGVFHPKLYLFEHDSREWDCILGSPNFTKAAFTVNEEVAVHFCHSDLNAANVYAQMDQILNTYFAEAKIVTEAQRSSYESIWRRQKCRLHRIAGTYSDPEEPQVCKSPLTSTLFNMKWVEYFEWVNKDQHHSVEGRLRVLEMARELFSSKPHFADLDLEDRRAIGGLNDEYGLNWLWFGSMRGAINFKARIRDNDATLSRALDAIPLAGPVTRKDFQTYISLAGPTLGKNNPLATATRLLALKRPDYFVCLDSKNETSFLKDFGITKKIQILDYWDRVVERIIDSNWWNSEEPKNDLARRIWHCRSAFLDVPWYDQH